MENGWIWGGVSRAIELDGGGEMRVGETVQYCRGTCAPADAATAPSSTAGVPSSEEAAASGAAHPSMGIV